MKRRLLTLLSVLVFMSAPALNVVSASTVPHTTRAPASAQSDQFGFRWNAQWVGWWRYACDPTGSAAATWRITFYRDANWTGDKVLICGGGNSGQGSLPNFCDVPLTPDPAAASCVPFTWGSLADQASSMVWAVNPGLCLVIYTNNDYMGAHTRLHDHGSTANMHTTTIDNDTASSMQLKAVTPCS